MSDEVQSIVDWLFALLVAGALLGSVLAVLYIAVCFWEIAA